MQRLIWVIALGAVVELGGPLAAPTAVRAMAQEQPSAEELNRKYADALSQLHAAQDRKNELASENETLKKRVEQLEKQLADVNRQAATWSEQTFRLRVHYAAWQAFLQRYPLLLEKWKIFVESDPLAA